MNDQERPWDTKHQQNDLTLVLHRRVETAAPGSRNQIELQSVRLMQHTGNMRID